jgi:hypothetical protein
MDKPNQAAEFRCHSAAGGVSARKFPLPDGSASSLKLLI